MSHVPNKKGYFFLKGDTRVLCITYFSLISTDKGYYPFASGCYKFSTDESTYEDAKATCSKSAESAGGYYGLVTIWDVHENQFIKAMNTVHNIYYPKVKLCQLVYLY